MSIAIGAVSPVIYQVDVVCHARSTAWRKELLVAYLNPAVDDIGMDACTCIHVGIVVGKTARQRALIDSIDAPWRTELRCAESYLAVLLHVLDSRVAAQRHGCGFGHFN